MLRLVLESQLFARFLYGLKISLIFVVIIFVDASQQALKLSFAGRSNQPDMDAPVDQSVGAGSSRCAARASVASPDADTDLHSAARKLLAERNAAVSGAALFVGLVRDFGHATKAARSSEPSHRSFGASSSSTSTLSSWSRS